MNIKRDCEGVDWELVSGILRTVGMAHHAPEVHQKAFENSQAVVFIYERDELIGFGRAISDRAYQAALYDVAILPEHQKKRLGTAIVNALLSDLPKCNVMLYAAPGKEDFYRKLGFRRMLTGMALFQNAAIMKARGFTD